MENIGDFSESDMLPKKRPRPSYKRKIIWNVKGNIERISNKIRKIEVAPNKIIAVKISETDEQEDDEITQTSDKGDKHEHTKEEDEDGNYDYVKIPKKEET